jgi:4-amino-4-deoxy-L-arabinose transferase-like glycosyltransferase
MSNSLGYFKYPYHPHLNMKRSKQRQTILTSRLRRKYPQVRISSSGIILIVLYLIWAFFWLYMSFKDANAYTSDCTLYFLLGTPHISFIAINNGINADPTSIFQWILYIGLCAGSLYLLILTFETIVRAIGRLINRK